MTVEFSEHPPIVRVSWFDSYIGSDGWTEIEESREAGRAMTARPITAAGFLVLDEPDRIIIASAFNQHADDVSGAIVIPKRSVVLIEQLHDGWVGS